MNKIFKKNKTEKNGEEETHTAAAVAVQYNVAFIVIVTY